MENANTRAFAPEYPRTKEGWIKFPSDVSQRKQLFFPEEVGRHPAKLNFNLQTSIIEYVGDKGDVLLDPFGGTGTLMVATLYGMRVVLIEVEDGYHDLEQKAKEELEKQIPECQGMVTLIHGDCRLILPLPVNHIITSPPYAGAMDIRRVRTKREDAPDDFLVEMDKQMMEYSKSTQNISKLNTFIYNMEMEKIYRKCAESLPRGGTLTIVVKDRIEGGKRVYLSKWVAKVCQSNGLSLELWEKWYALGSGFTKIARSQGKLVVDDEDIMIFRKNG